MVITRTVGILAACLFVVGTARGLADDGGGPVARWGLAGDAGESNGRFEARNHGVTFTGRGADGKAAAAVFDGRGAHLEVKPDVALRPGTGDFTVALWVHTDGSPNGSGDLVSMCDAEKRVGFNLALRTNPGTTGTANLRQLQFGIDAGSEPRWSDEGRPGNAILAFALTVHDGHLYAGTADSAAGAVGRVFRFSGHGEWVDCGAPDRCNTVTALTEHEGRLYAATGKYRFAGSAMVESDNLNPGGGIFRYEGGSKWSEVGRLPGVEAIAGLVAFRGRLHATSLYKPAGFFRLESDGKWNALDVPDGKRIQSMAVYHDALWATSYDDGRVYRYDGSRWEDLGRLGENTQTYSFVVDRGKLCVATWPSGKVYRWNDAGRWDDLGRLGEELEVMGMLVHNGQLYAGSLPLGAVFRYEGGQAWTKLSQLDTTPDVKYRRVWTMAEFGGRLFCSTLPSGRIHALEAGPCVTSDRALAAGWQHVAAVKHGGVLRLFVNGKAVAESRRFDPTKFNLANESPLRIGSGGGAFFHGSLGDVRLYRRALDEAELNNLIKP